MKFVSKFKQDLNYFDKLLNPDALIRGYLNRVVYPKMIAYEKARFISENVSVTGSPWTPLSPAYRDRKLKQAKTMGWPRGGQNIGVRTGRLVKSITGVDKGDHYKLVKDKRIEMGTMVPYAGYFNAGRDILELNDEFVRDVADGLVKYLTTEIKR